MSEADWLASASPEAMLDFLGNCGKASDRKLRLFTVACCRRAWPLLTDARLRQAIEVAERFCDGLVSVSELGRAFVRAAEVAQDPAYRVAPPYSEVAAIEHARIAAILASAGPANEVTASAASGAGHAAIAAAGLGWDEDRGGGLDKMRARLTVERGEQARLLRDIVGPLPFRDVRVDPSLLRWNDGTVPRIAQGIYDERAFERMPILADALLDAGCESHEMLAHCRQQEAVHARGCWVLDLLLGKE